jgi:alpha-tubulin suppressor-like RCC1 family protein
MVRIGERNEGVVRVATRGNHGVALMRDGSIFSWGQACASSIPSAACRPDRCANVQGDEGQLAIEAYSLPLPTNVHHFTPPMHIVAVACGHHFSMALSQEGELWCASLCQVALPAVAAGRVACAIR